MIISSSIEQIDEVIVGDSGIFVKICDDRWNFGIMWSASEDTPCKDGEYRHGFIIGVSTYEITKKDFDDFVSRKVLK